MEASQIFRRLFGRPAFVSYPKSGRTWMRYMLHLAQVRVRFTHAGHGTSARGMGQAFEGVKLAALGPRNIFMHRNPLDTAVSMYFQIHKVEFREGAPGFEETKGTLVSRGVSLPPTVIEEFVGHPTWGMENILRFNRAWLEQAERERMLVVTYEEARQDPEAVLSRVLSHLRRSGRNIDDIVRRSDFAEMQKLERAGADKALKLHGDTGDGDAQKVRRGKVRGYVDYLSPDTVAACSKLAREYGFEV
ncbi:MAG: sulfotransferase domain-containing protein [Devosia sp.]